MQELQIFNNEEFGKIRTVSIDGEPWFVGRDVAGALGYSNSRKAILDHVEDEDKGVTKCDTLGGKQELTIINESGLYALIFESKLESAKRFKRWVTSEVLPALRKTGTYTVTTTCQYPLTPASLDGATNAGRLLERVMRNEGAHPYEIAVVVKSIFQQAGIEIPECFIKIPAYEQLTINGLSY